MLSDKSEFCWILKDQHVVPANGSRPGIYVRELIDWGSHEFTSCPLSYTERLAIIQSVGERVILQSMMEIAREKQRVYSIEVQGQHDIQLLIRSACQESAMRSDETFLDN